MICMFQLKKCMFGLKDRVFKSNNSMFEIKDRMFELTLKTRHTSHLGPCVIRPFHFQFRKKMKFYFLFVLFIISSRFFETKLPYCRINADILNTKLKLLLYLT